MLHATVILDPPLDYAAFGNRKILSATVRARLAANAAALRQGRGAEPAVLRL
jgi:hypothetical protein